MIEKDNVSLIQRIDNELNLFYDEINSAEGNGIEYSNVSKDDVLESA